MSEVKECPNREENKKNCTCDYEPCERKGMCCECVVYHKSKDQVPACLR